MSDNAPDVVTFTSDDLPDYIAAVPPSVTLGLIAEVREARATIERVSGFVHDLDDALDSMPMDYSGRKLVERIIGEFRAALEGGQ